MDKVFEQIDIGLSLADAELESYFYIQCTLNIKIKTWNAKIIEFVFFDVIGFTDRGGNFIMNFCRNMSKNEFFDSIIKKNFDTNLKDNSYDLFQFLDIGNEPYLEIICKKFDWKAL